MQARESTGGLASRHAEEKAGMGTRQGPMDNGTMGTKEEAIMERISEVERPGLAVRAVYKIGERVFGAVPTPERIMAHRIPLMLGLGGLYCAIGGVSTIDTSPPPLPHLHFS